MNKPGVESAEPPHLLAHRVGETAWATLNRPGKMNSLSISMFNLLYSNLKAWEHDPSVKVVVLTGAENVFCAGADLKEVATPLRDSEVQHADFGERAFWALRDFPKPVVAAVNGIAVAGGLELILACDLVVAAQSARIGDAHANYGIFPGAGGAAVLPRKIPLNVAKQLLLTGALMSAAELKQHGLVNEVVEDAALQAFVQRLADQIAAKSPLGLARMKKVANESSDKALADALRHETQVFRLHNRSEDMKEGLSAFAQKRPPVFSGK